MARVSRKPDKTSYQETVSYRVGGYVRLSVEDMRKKESNSLSNQKELISRFVSEHNELAFHAFYEDVNRTGSNFNRCGFLQMIDDIKKGLINTVVVKDVSRFGRNFLETGAYIENIFPLLGVRFISINDNYDSSTCSTNDSLALPIKNLLNEMFVRDISRKIKSAYRAKRESGEFCGSVAPYGFLLQDKHLVEDCKVSSIVKEIFALFIDGATEYKIAKILNEKNIPPPSKYKYDNGIVKSDKYKNTALWYKSTVQKIIRNDTYYVFLSESEKAQLAKVL